MNESVQAGAGADRRSFFKQILAGGITAVLGLVPLGAGLAVIFDPLRRKTEQNGAVRVTTLDALPADGVPRRFQVIATRVDAWTKFKESPVGAVYLTRTVEGQVNAFNVVCPHAGCFVDFLPASGKFLCPCHRSTFAITGQVDNPSSPAARGLDSLDVEVREGKEVWVRFQNFQAGRKEKIPVA